MKTDRDFYMFIDFEIMVTKSCCIEQLSLQSILSFCHKYLFIDWLQRDSNFDELSKCHE